MDGGVALKRSWHTSENVSSSPNSELPTSPTLPTINRTLATPFSSLDKQRLPPITTSFDSSFPFQAVSPLLYNNSRRPGSQSRSSSDSAEGRSVKRTRLEDEPNSVQDLGTHVSREDHPRSSPWHRQIQTARSWNGAVHRSVDRGCENCSNTYDLVQALVKGLYDLESDLRRTSVSQQQDSGRPAAEASLFGSNLRVTDSSGPGEEEAEIILQQGLPYCLKWACQRVASSLQLLRNNPTLPKNLPPLGEAVANLDARPYLPQASITSAPLAELSRSLERPDRGGPADESNSSSATANPPDPTHRTFDTLPPIAAQEHIKRSGSHDLGSRRPPSPHQSSSGSVFGSVPSPMHSQHSGRTLPSPSTFQHSHTPSAAQGNYSPTHSHYAHAAHLQDLQHQISTKTLALQTLQREHDQLLAAFSRSQMRCSTLDKRSQVADHEINGLTEEKIRLQQQVEVLEKQVEELIQARDEARRQAAADGAQWRQIMAMSSQLQVQGADESRRYKNEREAWERDRAGLERRIQDLEAGKFHPDGPGVATPDTSTAADDILTSANLDVLRHEILRLRRSCSEMEVALREIQETGDQKLDEAMLAIASIREQIRGKTPLGTKDDHLAS